MFTLRIVQGVTKCYFLIISNNYPETGRVLYFLTCQNNGTAYHFSDWAIFKADRINLRSKTQRQNDLELEPLLGITTQVDVVLFQDHTRSHQNSDTCLAFSKIFQKSTIKWMAAVVCFQICPNQIPIVIHLRIPGVLPTLHKKHYIIRRNSIQKTTEKILK